MLASLRVAPVPLRAFDPPFAPGGTDRRSAPRNGPFSLTREWSIDHDRRASAAAKGYTAREHLAEATRPAIIRVALHSREWSPPASAALCQQPRAPTPAVAASIVPGLRHAEHACNSRDREAGLVRAHEFEDPDGTAPVSRADQAAARERISRSSRSCLFSRRSRANSSRSAAASPSPFSSRRPSFRSACATHWQIEVVPDFRTGS